MENIRLILFAALCFVGLQLYLAWEVDYGQASQVVTEPSKEQDKFEQAAAADPPSAVPGTNNAPSPSLGAETPALPHIRVTTDVLEIAINPAGGAIDQASLSLFPIAVDDPGDPFVVLDRSGNRSYYVQSGLAGNVAAPDHRALFTSDQDAYALIEGQDSVKVSLFWRHESGVTIEKVFTLARASYVIDIDYIVHNGSDEPWSARPYVQAQRREVSNRGFVYSFNGIALSSADDRYQKHDFDSLADSDINQEIAGGWAALIQHYFIVALLPADERSHRYYSRVLDEDHYLVGMVGPTTAVAPGADAQIETRLFVGPKLQHVLPGVAEGLALTVDYGVFWPIAKPLFWALEQVQGVFGNWGWAIVFITLLLKVLFYPLQSRAYRSMARMRKLQPRMQALRDRYGDDPQRLRTAMAELYRAEKFNPLGGCLPTLLQIPVFISLYWVLLESVEMRQATFVLWLNDLSSPDPYYVLPLVMGITMYFTQKLNPAPPDPMQAKVMQILPIVFTLFYVFLPSGLVLYWTVQSALSLVQQYLITRKAEAEPA